MTEEPTESNAIDGENVHTIRAPKDTDPNMRELSKLYGGSEVKAFNDRVLGDVDRAIWKPEIESEFYEEWRASANTLSAYAMVGIRPQNELEGLVAAQIVMTYAAASECFKRAAIAEQPAEFRNANINLATKSARTMAALIESLQKLRGETGKQSVVVHHHHHDSRTQVAAGQAVVNVGQPPQGGGENENSGQPHEPDAIDHRPAETVDVSAAVRSEESAREPVPVASDARQETMPPARRKKPRRA